MEGFEACLDAELARLEEESRDCLGSRIMVDPLMAFLRRGGKRLRPRLMLAAHSGYSDEPREKVLHAAAALELFHAFALIHDDIVDESPRRRGGPSLHVLMAEAANRSGSGADGRSLAMLAGDVVYSAALRTFLACGASPGRKEAALRELMGTAVRTGLGALAELSLRHRALQEVTRERILDLYEAKTALYTFSCPLRVGAVLAGVGAAELERLGEYGRLVGTAFQIADDLEDLGAYLRSRSGAERLRLCEAKVMLPVWHVRSRAGAVDSRWLEELFLKSRAGPADRARLAAMVERTEAVEESVREAETMLDCAEAIGSGLAIRPGALGGLEGYVRTLLAPAMRRPGSADRAQKLIDSVRKGP